MNWEFLLLLACPLMMLFCMKGMFSGKKDDVKATGGIQMNTSTQEMQALQLKMTEMMEQNQMLMNEVKELRVQKENPMPVLQNKEQDQANVVNINKKNSEGKKTKEII